MARAFVDTAAFGRVQATFYMNTRWAGEDNSEDSAAIVFPCEDTRGTPVIPISTQPLQDLEDVYYGKVMRVPGLYRGTIYREPGVIGINGRSPRNGSAAFGICHPTGGFRRRAVPKDRRSTRARRRALDRKPQGKSQAPRKLRDE
jgi:hypothetical protein